MRAVALTLCLTVLCTACFPTNPKARLYAKITEGSLAAIGIAILSVVNTSADCDAKGQPGKPDSNCRDKATVFSDIGFGLILAGLIGFIATVSTTPDDKPDVPIAPPAPAPAPVPPPEPTPPAPVPAPVPAPDSGSGAGSDQPAPVPPAPEAPVTP